MLFRIDCLDLGIDVAPPGRPDDYVLGLALQTHRCFSGCLRAFRWTMLCCAHTASEALGSSCCMVFSWGFVRGSPGNTCINPVWLEMCNPSLTTPGPRTPV